MKKIKLFAGLIVALLFILSSCEEESNDVCSKFESPNCSALIFTVCSDGDSDYLKYDGKDYPCVTENGEEDICDNEADAIINDAGCSASLINLKTSSVSYKSFVLNAVKKVRAEAIAAAGCN